MRPKKRQPTGEGDLFRARLDQLRPSPCRSSGAHWEKVAPRNVPAGFRIIPGMPVTADIKVGKRTVLQYLLGLILPVTREGMREP
jgi:multidrug efflux pump subunit AcrA (membrane-fusion protein)